MQNVYGLYSTLNDHLKQYLLPLDNRNATTTVWMVLAVILSKSVSLASWDVALSFEVNAASTIRRFSRWLHNVKIDIVQIYDGIVA